LRTITQFQGRARGEITRQRCGQEYERRRWNLKEDRQDDKGVTHAVLKTIAAFLNTEGGDLLIGVADDGSIIGIERDQLESDAKFIRHLAQVVRNGLGDRAGTCIGPKTQVVDGKTVCVASCQRSPEPVFLKWKGLETPPDGDLFVRSGPGTVKLPPDATTSDSEPGLISRTRMALLTIPVRRADGTPWPAMSRTCPVSARRN
jgi:hypothetical protein